MTAKLSATEILLVYPNCRGNVGIPYGVACLCGNLTRAGVSYNVFDTTFIDTTDCVSAFLDVLKSAPPRVIGFSVSELSWPLASLLLDALPPTGQRPHVLCGGIFATAAPNLVLDHPSVDAVCLGEADHILPQLVRTDLVDWQSSPNVLTKQGYDVPILCAAKPTPADLENIAIPDFTQFNLRHYVRPFPSSKPIRRLGITATSRGCPFSCPYCCNSVLRSLYGSSANSPRERPICDVIEDLLAQVHLASIDYVNFLDDTMLLNKTRLIQLLRSYKEAIGLPFFICTRPETVDKDIVSVLREAGCDCIALGVESGSEEYRRQYLGRTMSNVTIASAFDIIHEQGIKTMSTNMVGLPYETPEMMEATLVLNAYSKVDYIGLSVFFPFIGTPLGDFARREGLVDKSVALPNTFREYTLLDQPQLPSQSVNRFFSTFHKQISTKRHNGI